MLALTDGESRIVGFGGGIRGTKTWGSLAAIIALCRIFPGSRWAVIRKDLQRIRDTVVPSFDKLRVLAGGFVGPIMHDTWTATCTNGSAILFRGESIDKDPELLRFHGYEVNGFLNEEADELSERTLTKEKERAGTWIIPGDVVQPPAFILNTFNPCASWPRRVFYIPWRDQTLRAPYAFIPSTAADNPYISDAQRDAWKEMPESEYRRFVLGDWEALTGAYYDTLNVQVHLIDRTALPKEIPAHWRRWGSFDWGYRHWSVFGAWVTDDDGVDYLLKSVWARKLQDDQLASLLVQEIEPDHFTMVFAGHDCWNKVTARGASGESTMEIFAKQHIALVRADIDLVNGGRAVNRQLNVQNGRAGAYIVKEPGNLRVFDQLGEIIPDTNDVRKPMKVDADEQGLGGDDGADMFRYGLASRVANRASRAPEPPSKIAHRARPIEVEGGRMVPHSKIPKTADELAEWAASKMTQGRLPIREKERLPRRRYR